MQLLQQILAGLLGVVALVLAFVFASVVLAVAVVVGLLIWAWLWWRSRKLRAAWAEEMRNDIDRPVAGRGEVIEGEFREVVADPPRVRDDDRQA